MTQEIIYNIGDTACIIDVNTLFIEARGMHFAKNFFTKKYDQTCLDVKTISIMAYNDRKQPIAHCAIIPQLIQKKNNVILVGQLCDVVVHPNYRGKNLVTHVINAAINRAKEKGLKEVYAFPNENLFPILTENMHWQYIHRLNYYEFPTPCIPVNKIANKLRLYSIYDFFIKIVCAFIKDTRNVFGGSALENRNNYTVMKDNTVNWKNYTSTYRIKLGNVYVWFKTEDGMWIGDMENITEKNFNSTIKKIKRLCFILGYHNIKFVTSPGGYLDQFFQTITKPTEGPYLVNIPIEYITIQPVIFTAIDINTY